MNSSTLNRRSILRSLAVLAPGFTLSAAQAQEATFPSKPIRIIVGSAPGALLDVSMRLYAELMSATLKQSVVVENMAGASSTLAARQVAKAAPDGYTLLAAANTVMTVPHVSKTAGYTARDFVGVGELARSPSLLVVPGNSAHNTLADLVAAAKKSPGQLPYASAGVATTSHLPAEMFLRQAGITMTHVPYKGVSAAVPDVVAGRVHFLMGTATSFAELMKSGGLRALAITAANRSPAFPDVPTFKELGYPEVAFDIWVGVLAPAATPRAVIQRLGEAMEAARSDPALNRRLETTGQAIAPLRTPERFDAFLREEDEKYRKLVKEANITAD